jgi:glutamine synthetase
VIDLGDVREQFRESKVRRVKLCAADMDGVLRGKWISTEKFTSMVEST